jgi:hypothetical protein
LKLTISFYLKNYYRPDSSRLACIQRTNNHGWLETLM